MDTLLRQAQIINENRYTTVFPDTYWIQSDQNYLLCYSGALERSPQVLALVTPHPGGGGSHAVYRLYNAGQFIPFAGMDNENNFVFTITPGDIRKLTLRYKAIRTLSQYGLSGTQGMVVNEIAKVFVPKEGPIAVLSKRAEVVEEEIVDDRLVMDDLEGDWSLL